MSNDKWWERASGWLAEQVAEAVTDIRRRVVEEPWFGAPQDGPTGASLTQASTAGDAAPELDDDFQHRLAAEFFHTRPDEPGPSEPEHGHDKGMDR